MASNPLSILRTARGRYDEGIDQPTTPGTGLQQTNFNDPAANLLTLDRQLQSETARNAAAGLNPMASYYTQDYGRDIAENPVTKQGQAQDLADQANAAAKLKGFLGGGDVAQDTPAQQAGQYGRQQAETNSPSNVEYIKGVLGLRGKELEAQAQRDIASTRAGAYDTRTQAQRAKAVLDNAAKVQVAQMHSPGAAAQVQNLSRELRDIHEGLLTGRLSEDNPTVKARIDAIEAEITRVSGAGGAAPAAVHPQAAADAKQLISAHPGGSVDQLLEIANGESPFERPQDRETLRQALIAAGAR